MNRCAALLLLGLLAGAEPAAPLDRHGDPLPDGALARLGTTHQRVAASKLAMSADGRTIITVGAGRVVGRWDAVTGRLRGFRRLPGPPTDQFWLSSDGRLLAVGDGKEGLAVFDTETGARKRTMPGRSVAFAPDGQSLVTIENGKPAATLHLWDLATGKERLLVKLPSDANNFHIHDFAFSADGKRLFATAYLVQPMYVLYSLRCWGLDSGKEVWKTEGTTFCGDQLAVSPGGRTLCSISHGAKGVRLWDAGTGRDLGTIPTEKDRWLNRVAFAADGRTVIVAASHDILLCDTARRTIRHRLAGAGPTYAVAPDGKTLVSLAGSLLQRWDVATGRPLYPDTADQGHTNAVQGVIFTPDGRRLVSVGGDETLRVWDLTDPRPRTLATGIPYRLGIIYAGSPDEWHSLFSPPVLDVTADGRRLLSETNDRCLRLTDIETGEEVRRFNMRDWDNEAHVSTARLSADGRKLWALTHHYLQPTSQIVLEQKEGLIAWDTTTGRRMSARSVLCGNLPDNIIAPHGRSVVLANGEVRDVASGELHPHPKDFYLSQPHALSADGRLMAGICGEWDKIGVRELLTGQRVVQVEAPVSHASQFAFSPDGRLLVVAGADALHVWEVSTGRRLLHLPALGRLSGGLPGSFGTSLAVAPDGRSAATGHEDGTVLVWDLAPVWRRLAERPSAAPTDAELDACWADLLREDPRTAYTAMDRMAAAPAQAASLLRKHLKPVTVDSQWLADRLAALDSPDFADREKASRDLEGVAEAIEPRLRREMERTASPEVRGRLRRILEAPRPLVPPTETVRQLRAVAVLERLASAEARALLRELAKGEPAARLTIAASEALARLTAADRHKKRFAD